jgi:hypothetical protein
MDFGGKELAKSMCVTRSVLTLSLLVLVQSGVWALDEVPSPVATTPHFALFSDFATNLNDALIVAGTARSDERAELFSDGSEAAACLAERPGSVRLGWDLAVDFYAQVIPPTSWMGRQQYLLRADLAAFDEDFDDRARRFMKSVEGVRMAAAAAYEACGWPAQDAENRRFLEPLMPRLAVHEAAITRRLVELYATPWSGLPVRVESSRRRCRSVRARFTHLRTS